MQIKIGVRLFLALLLVTLVWDSPKPTQAQEVTTRTITLAEGTQLEVIMRRVTEDGIEFEYQGARMQLGWDLLNGATFARARRALVVRTDAEQVKRWAEWCYANHQLDDLEDASAVYLKLTKEELVFKANEVVDVVGKDVDEDPADAVVKAPEKERKPRGQENPANPNIKKVYLDIDSKEVAFKAGFEKALKGQLLEIVTKESEADAVITLVKPQLTLVKNPKFFGASAFVEYHAKSTVRLTIKDKASERDFDSGLVRTFPREISDKESGAKNNAAVEAALHELGRSKATKNIAQSLVMWMVYGQ